VICGVTEIEKGAEDMQVVLFKEAREKAAKEDWDSIFTLSEVDLFCFDHLLCAVEVSAPTYTPEGRAELC
jgi:hypothetical protein